MCGLFGYSGKKAFSKIGTNALLDLQHRGYDSFGLATIDNNKLALFKSTDVNELSRSIELNGYTGIAHNRWATHGKVCRSNAHPHVSKDQKVAIVHNGIIDNADELIEKYGFQKSNDTDSEVIALLFSHLYNGDLIATLRAVIEELSGSYAVVIIHIDHPQKMLAAAKNSPCLVGLNADKDVFIASDSRPLYPHITQAMPLKDGEMSLCEKGCLPRIYMACGSEIDFSPSLFSATDYQFQKQKVHKHYMIDEVYQQPQLLDTLINTFIPSNDIQREFEKADNIIYVGCGSSYHVALLSSLATERFLEKKSAAVCASEWNEQHPIRTNKTVVVALSQSGETADTIRAVKLALQSQCRIVGVCNTPNSYLERLSHHCIKMNAGMEVSVCATKTFTSQWMVVWLTILHTLKHKDREQFESFYASLTTLPKRLKTILNNVAESTPIIDELVAKQHILFVGRSYMYPIALESALKLREIGYVYAFGVMAGELKHGTLALVDEQTDVLVFTGNKETAKNDHHTINEIKARNGRPLIIGTTYQSYANLRELKCSDDIDFISRTFEATIWGQYVAYYIANKKGLPVDKPRNLAKSVTVE